MVNQIIAAVCIAGAAMILIPIIVIGVVLFSFALMLIWAWPLMWAWNYVIPIVFGLAAITYWQAYCLLVVSMLLIKGSGACSTPVSSKSDK